MRSNKIMKNTLKKNKNHPGHVCSKWEQLHRSYYFHLIDRNLRPKGSSLAYAWGHSLIPAGSEVGYGAGCA